MRLRALSIASSTSSLSLSLPLSLSFANIFSSVPLPFPTVCRIFIWFRIILQCLWMDFGIRVNSCCMANPFVMSIFSLSKANINMMMPMVWTTKEHTECSFTKIDKVEICLIYILLLLQRRHRLTKRSHHEAHWQFFFCLHFIEMRLLLMHCRNYSHPFAKHSLCYLRETLFNLFKKAYFLTIQQLQSFYPIFRFFSLYFFHLFSFCCI